LALCFVVAPLRILLQLTCCLKELSSRSGPSAFRSQIWVLVFIQCYQSLLSVVFLLSMTVHPPWSILGVSEDEIAQFVATYVEGVPVLHQACVGAAWCKADADWHHRYSSALQAALVEAFPAQVGGPEIRWQMSYPALPWSPSCSSFGQASRQPG
jgi:hypothetical protein